MEVYQHVRVLKGFFTVVGLPDIAVKESRERIRAALRNCSFDFPSGHAVTINLAPADIRKEGSAFDLPIALGLAGCQGSCFGKDLDTHVFLGELSLDGGVRSVRGALSAVFICGTWTDDVEETPFGRLFRCEVVCQHPC